MLLIEWLHLIRISILQTLQNINGRTKYSNLSHMLFSRSQPRSVLYPGENVLLQKHLLKQRHHKQILRFRHHLVRTLLLLCCHLIQTLCWQRYQGQVPLPGYNRHISICHIFEACKPLTKLREQRTLHCSLTIPLQHLSVTSIESLCKSFFSNSPTKQLLLLFLFGLKHVDRTLKGNFEKQAELTSSLLLKLNNSTTNLYFVVLYQW